MNTAHFHLMLNHFPVIGFTLGFLILASGYILKQASVKRMALSVFILSALMAIPAFLTGEGAEEVVEALAGFEGSFVNTHEDWASVFVWFAGGLGILSVITLLFDFRKWPSAALLYLAVLILSFSSVGLCWRVSNSGGEIRHTEIRNGAMVQNAINSGEEEGD